MSYQWVEENGSTITTLANGTLADGTTFSQVTTRTLQIAGTTAADAGNYALQVTDGTGASATSQPISLTIKPAAAPAITTQPANVTVVAGNPASFSVTATGSYPRTYQWYKGTPPNGTAISASNSDPFTISYPLAADAGSYYVVISNAFGYSPPSAAATLTVTAATPITFTATPGPITITAGQYLGFTEFLSGSGPQTYQWQKGGTPIAGATSNSYSVASATAADAGTYTLVATNAAGSATSPSISVTVNPAIAPTITTSPSSISVAQGSSANFSATIAGSSPITYQWTKNGQAIAGANSINYYISAVQPSDAGDYGVTVTNVAGSATSHAATLTVLPPAPPSFGTAGPTSQSTTVGFSLTLQPPYISGGYAPFTYQWYKNWSPIVGATSSTYTISSAQLSDSGSYFVAVTNSGGTVNAPLISVTVNAPPNSGAAWIDAAQQGSVIYFLFAQHIERYDTASAAWLPSVSFSQTATAFCNASDGIYVAFGRTLARYTFDLSSETTLTNLGGSVVAVFSFGAYVYAVSEDSFPGVIYPVDRNTGAVGTTSTIYVDTAVAFAVVPSANKAFCPDTIWDYMSFNLASSGAVTSNNFKYYDTFPGGNRIYVFPDQSRVADNGGTIYSVATDSIAGSFAGSFTDMTFLADGTPVILRGSTLYEFGGAALAEIGHASLAVTGARIFGQGQNVLVFYPSAAAGNGYVGLSQFAANGFVASYPSAPAVNPAGLSFTPDAVAQDASGVVYLFSKSTQNILRWSPTTQTYLGSIGLSGAPSTVVYSASMGRLICVYQSGKMTQIDPSAGSPSEQPFAAFPDAPVAVAVAGDYVFAVLQDGEDSGEEEAVLDSSGRIADFEGWSYYSSSFTWSSANQSLYDVYNYSINALPVASTGKLGANVSYGYSTGSLSGPVFVSPDGSRALTANGSIYSTTPLRLLGGVANSVTDGTWSGNAPVTLHPGSAGSEVQSWSASSFLLTGVAELPGSPLRLLSLGANQFLAITLNGGAPAFTILNQDLQVVSSTVAAMAGAPAFQSLPAGSISVFAGSSLDLAVGTSGSLPQTFQWYKGGAAIPGATSSILRFSSVAAGDAANYYVTATNSQGTATSGTTTLGVYPALQFATQPQNQTAPYNGSATFSVTVANGVTPTYQWYFNGTAISGAGSSTLVVSPVTSSNTGVYFVTISNPAGVVSSNSATLSYSVATAPQITTALVSESVLIGGNASFFVSATGNPAPSYQWSHGGALIAGATTSTFTIVGVQSTDAGLYTVTVSNSAGSVGSSANLTVMPVSAAPSLTTQPVSQTVGAGGAVTFTVVATGSPPPTYQWQHNGSNIPGATNATLTLTGTQPANAGSYDVVVSNSAGQVTSSVVTLALVSPYTFTTMAGIALTGSSDGTGSAARFYNPNSVAVDGAGNVYVADTYNSTIRKIAPGGVVTTLAGKTGVSGMADGTGSSARFYMPSGIAVDAAGNLYVADSSNSLIRKITPDGVVTTMAGGAYVFGSSDGPGSSARFGAPNGIAVDAACNLYVADTYNDTIRKITPNGVVTTLAGMAGSQGSADGTGSAARFYQPNGVAVDGSGNVYVADTLNAAIRKVTPGGVVTTIAGVAGLGGSVDGTGTAARFSMVCGLTADGAGNVYVMDTGNCTIRKITTGGVVTTLAGTAMATGSSDGTGSAARFYSSRGIAVDGAGNLYVADTGNCAIRAVTPGGVVTTLAGAPRAIGSSDGTGIAARFFQPSGVAVDSAGDAYVADRLNNTIRKITPGGGVTTFAGTAGISGSADGMGAAARFNGPAAVALDGNGNVYVAEAANNTIRMITSAGVVSTLAGSAGYRGSADGNGNAARFAAPFGLTVDGAGNVYVADSGNCTIRKITPGGVVTTLAGTAGVFGTADGTGSAARFYDPEGVALDGIGNLYVADSANYTIRKITPGNEVTTVAGSAGVGGSADGTGITARFCLPGAVAVDGIGNIYVADTGNFTIREITLDGLVTTLAGVAGFAGSTDGTGSAAQFNNPRGIAVDRAGSLYVADLGNCTIRKGASSYPMIETQPSSLAVTAGSAAVLSVGASAGTALSYQWQLNGVAISGATGATYTIASAQPSDAGNYTVAVSNGSSVITSQAATLAVNPATKPVFTTQPQSQSATSGSKVTLYAAASGSPTPAYQWYLNSAAIAGATNGSYVIASAQASDSGSYTVVATNAAGSATSAIAVLTVSAPLSAPAITTQPQNQSATAGTTVTFTALASGNPAPAYQWLFGGQTIPGATTATLTLANVTLTSTGYYSVVATNSVGSATSSSVLLTINELPNITRQPTSASVPQNQSVTFTVVAFGNPAPTFQWQKNGVNIDGATVSTFVNGSWTSTYTLSTPQPGNAGNYDVVVSNAAGHVTSNVVTLTIAVSGYTFTTLAGAPQQSGSADGTGNAARFSYASELSADASGNVYVADTQNDTIRKITLGGVVTTLAGTPGAYGSADGTGNAARFNYPSGVAADGAGNVYVTDWANCTVRKVTPGGVVTTLAGKAGVLGSADGMGSAARFGEPAGVAADAAGNVYVADTGNQTIRKITQDGTVTTIAGAVGLAGSADGKGGAARFNNPNALAVDLAGNVYVSDANNGIVRKITPGGVVTTLVDSTGATVPFFLPYGVAVDASGNVYVGETANDRIQMVSPAGVVTTLAGSKGVTGSADGAGNLALFYFPRGVAVDPFGNVYVADSQNSTIRKGTSIAPIIGTPPSSFAVVAGSASTLSVGASGSTALTYQWYFNGQPISGATNASYSISSTQVANSGSYTVVATNAAGSATSPTAMLTVSAASGGPAITSQPASQTIATGSTVVFSVNSSGIVQSSSSSSSDGPRADARLQADASGTSATYQWYLNGAPIAGAANAILVVQATANSAGAYTCLVSNSNGSVLSNAATLSVTNTPPNPGRLINLSTLAVAGGGSQTLTVGFFVGGTGTTGSQSLLVQALGPTVSTMGVSGVMPDPQLNLFSGQTVIGANCGWGCTPGNQQAVSAADAATYATALADPASKDSAVVVPLAPGGYTAQVNSVSGVTGKTLTAFYDDTPSGTYGPTTPRLINLSCRLLVGSNSSLTAGFWIGGTTAKTVLIRANGPALTAQNVTGVMPDPQLTVYNSADTAIAYNAGWGGSSVLSSVAASVYAQPFTDPNSKDSEVLLTLAPGGYTAQVSSASNTAGNVMIEVYEVP